jgi:thymidine kinase
MNWSNNTSGFLEVIIGPMFSGKTTKILDIYKQCKICDIPVIVINHNYDIRYNENPLELMSHNNDTIPCIRCDSLADVWNPTLYSSTINESNPNYPTLKAVYNSKIILINEGQFFNDLYDTVTSMLKHKKKIYVCGLDGDYKRCKFGQILDLIPICDNVIKLKALCAMCKNGNCGIFSKRICSGTQQTVIGTTNYMVVCRYCYEK